MIYSFKKIESNAFKVNWVLTIFNSFHGTYAFLPSLQIQTKSVTIIFYCTWRKLNLKRVLDRPNPKLTSSDIITLGGFVLIGMWYCGNRRLRRVIVRFQITTLPRRFISSTSNWYRALLKAIKASMINLQKDFSDMWHRQWRRVWRHWVSFRP